MNSGDLKYSTRDTWTTFWSLTALILIYFHNIFNIIGQDSSQKMTFCVLWENESLLGLVNEMNYNFWANNTLNIATFFYNYINFALC